MELRNAKSKNSLESYDLNTVGYGKRGNNLVISDPSFYLDQPLYSNRIRIKKKGKKNTKVNEEHFIKNEDLS